MEEVWSTVYNAKPTVGAQDQGPNLLNILRQSYEYLTIFPKLRSTCDGRLIYKTSHEGRKAFLRYRFTYKVVRSFETVLAK